MLLSADNAKQCPLDIKWMPTFSDTCYAFVAARMHFQMLRSSAGDIFINTHVAAVCGALLAVTIALCASLDGERPQLSTLKIFAGVRVHAPVQTLEAGTKAHQKAVSTAAKAKILAQWMHHSILAPTLQDKVSRLAAPTKITDGACPSVILGSVVHLQEDTHDGEAWTVNVMYNDDSAPAGLKWEEGSLKDSNKGGISTNVALVVALKNTKLVFNQDEFDKFHVSDMSCDRYVVVGERCFLPAHHKVQAGYIRSIPFGTEQDMMFYAPDD